MSGALLSCALGRMDTGKTVTVTIAMAPPTAGATITTQASVTADQTRRELGQMIAGGRTKWNLPNPAHEVDPSHQPLPPIAPAFVDSLNVAMLPRRRWLLGGARWGGPAARGAGGGAAAAGRLMNR